MYKGKLTGCRQTLDEGVKALINHSSEFKIQCNGDDVMYTFSTDSLKKFTACSTLLQLAVQGIITNTKPI